MEVQEGTQLQLWRDSKGEKKDEEKRGEKRMLVKDSVLPVFFRKKCILSGLAQPTLQKNPIQRKNKKYFKL